MLQRTNNWLLPDYKRHGSLLVGSGFGVPNDVLLEHLSYKRLVPRRKRIARL
jgi:hypothetical protein